MKNVNELIGEFRCKVKLLVDDYERRLRELGEESEMELILADSTFDEDGNVPLWLEKMDNGVAVRMGYKEMYLVKFKIIDGKIKMYRYQGIGDKRVQIDSKGRIEEC